MALKRIQLIAVVAVGLGLVACTSVTPAAGGNPTGSPEETSTLVPATVMVPTAAPGTIQPSAGVTFTVGADTLAGLQNMTYTIDGEQYTLVGGAYQRSDHEKIDLIPPAATGDLNGDGVGDAAVLLAAHAGGSGVFVYLAAVVDQAGKLANADTVLLEDRLDVHAMTIADGVITLDVTAHGPNDPMCCPTQQATWTYVLEDGKLRLTSEAGPMKAAVP